MAGVVFASGDRGAAVFASIACENSRVYKSEKMTLSCIKTHVNIKKFVKSCHTWGATTGVATSCFLACPTILTREGETISRDATPAFLTVRT